MKRIIKAFIFIPFLLFYSCNQNDCNWEKGKLKDYSGLDCCTWVIELNNGEFLEPVNIESFNINLKNNNKICVKYLVLNNVHSCCMFGQIVEIEDIN